ncbi:MAG TPA: hypothetical protein VF015_03165 [Acidimicrobiales bacterium]
MAVATSAVITCSVLRPEGEHRGPDGTIDSHEACHADRRELWRSLVDEFRPDVVVYYLANAGLPGHQLLDGEWVSDRNPAYDAYMADALGDDAAVLQRGGATLLVTTTPQPAVLDLHSREQVACRNDTTPRWRPRSPTPP